MIVTRMPSTARPAEMKPMYVASCSGKYENEVMPSSANLSIFFSGYFVSPA